jgi:hypothetical protein
VEANIGTIYQTAGLEEAFAHMECELLPLFKKQQTNFKKQQTNRNRR